MKGSAFCQFTHIAYNNIIHYFRKMSRGVVSISAFSYKKQFELQHNIQNGIRDISSRRKPLDLLKQQHHFPVIPVHTFPRYPHER